MRVDWHGEAADRLLDADHAATVEQLVASLRRSGWEVVPEVTFNDRGERGSIDVLAWHAETATLLVVEVKTVIPDVQGMLSTFDRKVRHADGIARARGWRPRRIWTLLAISEDRTSRRRVELHEATFASRFPHRSREARRYLADPGSVPEGSAPLRALWFLPNRTKAGTRHRVAWRRDGG